MKRLAALLCASLASTLISAAAIAGTRVSVALNWVPEPEFGGIYQAQLDGTYAKHGLDVTIKPGGAGAPTWQQVASAQADFGVCSADEVVIARSQGADVVAIFTTYQTCPQGIMVHKSRGLTKIEDVFKNPGTLAMEVGLPYEKFLQKKFGFKQVKRIPYDGGIANFLADANFAQQCFVFSEPIAASKAGSDPQTFLIADAGYNPYTGVIVARGDYIKQHADVVKAMIDSLQAGWKAYLADPARANDAMGRINKTMDSETFKAAAEAQKPLIESNETRKSGIGSMALDRWRELVDQLDDLKAIDTKISPADCFYSPK